MDKYLEKYKDITSFPSKTLFEPAWESLLVDRCPLCNNKMRRTRDGKRIMCLSNKHSAFVMKLDRHTSV